MFGFEPERITHLILYISKITFFTQLWSILVMYRIYLCRSVNIMSFHKALYPVLQQRRFVNLCLELSSSSIETHCRL